MDNDKARRSSAAACFLVLASLALNGTAAAQVGAAEDDGRPSIAQECLNHPSIRRTKVLNDRNIVFVTRDHKIYNNQLPRQCPSLKRNSLVNYVIERSRLCAGGAFQVLWQLGSNNYAPAFVCRLGNFVPITESELEDLTAMTEENRGRRLSRRSTRETVTSEEVELDPAQPAGSTPEAAAPAAVESESTATPATE